MSNGVMIIIICILMIQKRKRCVQILGRAVVTQILFGTQKYLGAIFDNKLCWIEKVSSNVKKANARLHYLRKLRSLGVSASLLAIFYSAVVCSALTFGVVCWGGNVS